VTRGRSEGRSHVHVMRGRSRVHVRRGRSHVHVRRGAVMFMREGEQSCP